MQSGIQGQFSTCGISILQERRFMPWLLHFQSCSSSGVAELGPRPTLENKKEMRDSWFQIGTDLSEAPTEAVNQWMKDFCLSFSIICLINKAKETFKTSVEYTLSA